MSFWDELAIDIKSMEDKEQHQRIISLMCQAKSTYKNNDEFSLFPDLVCLLPIFKTHPTLQTQLKVV